MKTFTQLAFVLMCLGYFSVAKGQTIFLNANFEGSTSLPNGWTQTTNATDGGYKIGTGAALSSSSWTIPDHSNIIATNDDGCNCDKSVDYLYTPTFSLVGATGARLVFDLYYFDGSYNGVQENAWVDITTDGGNSWTQLIDLSGDANWQQVEVDMSLYLGQPNVKLKFAYSDNSGFIYGLALDNIQVYQPAANDVALTAINVNEYVQAGYLQLTGTVRNIGSQPITEFDVTWSLDGGATNHTEHITGENILPLTTYSFNHAIGLDVFTPNNYTLRVIADNPNGQVDGNQSNDTLSKQFASISTLPDKNVLIEEYTGAWCQYCPDGAVRLLDILNTVPRAIGVAIHDNDGMAFTVGDQIIAAYATGFPAGTVDRYNFTDLGGVELNRGLWADAVDMQLLKVVPATISATNTYDANTRQLTATVSAEFFAQLSGEYRMSLMIVEDSVTGTGSQYNQVNAFNNTAGHPYQGAGNPIVGFVHRHVLRQVLGGAWGQTGSIGNNVQIDSIYSYTFNTTLNAAWNANRIKLVAVLQKYSASASDREILNAVEFDLNDTATIAASVAADYGVTVATVTNSTCTGANNATATAVAKGTAPFTFAWSNGDTGETADSLAPGRYVVTVTDANNNTATYSFKVYENQESCTVGINETEQSIKASVYPNPNDGSFMIAAQLGGNANARVEVYNVLGEKVWEQNFGLTAAVNSRINLSNAAQGIYFVKLTAGEQSIVKKVQVQ